MRKAVFLDRDGVLSKNIDGDYIRNISQIKLLPSAKEAVAKLYDANFEIVIVTNQAAVNKGIMSYSDAKIVQSEIVRLLDPSGVIDIKSEICPHTSNDSCSCRKPEPGMILSACEKYDLDLQRSYMVGDAWSDMQAALAAKVRPIMVLSGRGKASDIKTDGDAIPVFSHIGEAADFICKRAV